MAARNLRDMGEMQEKVGLMEECLEWYGKAAELFEIENQSSEVNRCRLKIGQISAGLERFAVAIEMFESVAKSQVKNNLTKYSAKGNLLNAALCRLNGEAQVEAFSSVVAFKDEASVQNVDVECCQLFLAAVDDEPTLRAMLKRYDDMDENFRDSREATFLMSLVEAKVADDCQKFLDAVAEYDSLTRLDGWKTQLLVGVKKILTAVAEGPGEENVEDKGSGQRHALLFTSSGIGMGQQSPFRGDTLNGKVAFVTGGGSGIGYEIARQLGLHGAKVAIMGRRQQVIQDSAEKLQSEGVEAIGVQGDVRELKDCESAVAAATGKWGRLDILINAAAGNFLAPAEVLSPKGFKTVFDIDTLGTFTMCKAAFKPLKACQSGCIINISMTLHYGATWYQTHASAAKAAIDSMTRSLALEWGYYGIRVSGIAPGWIGDTTGFEKLGGFQQNKQKEMLEGIPLSRFGSKWDIAMACIYLASPAGSYVSGSALVVDGAQWLYKKPGVPMDVVLKASRDMEAKAKKGKPASKL
ncbi:hypothetical protein ABBQ38_014810 [Trebouxia sp. C0009 RCD-2024]